MKKTILIIDDMPTILEHTRQILKNNFKVIPATSGIGALEIMEKVKPDLVLLDLNMPDMDGFETINRMKKNPDTSDIPIIIATTDLTLASEAKAYKCGAEDFLRKPFTVPALYHKINNQLELYAFRRGERWNPVEY